MPVLVIIAVIAEMIFAAQFGTQTERRRVCDMINEGIHNALAQPGGSYEMSPETLHYYATYCREEESEGGTPQF